MAANLASSQLAGVDPALLAEGSHIRANRVDLDAQLLNEREQIGPARNTAKINVLRDKLTMAQRNYDDWFTRLRTQTGAGALRSADPLTVEEIQRRIKPGETLLSYFFTPAQGFCFVATRDQFRMVGLQTSGGEIDRLASAYRATVKDAAPHPEVLRQAARSGVAAGGEAIHQDGNRHCVSASRASLRPLWSTHRWDKVVRAR